MSRNKPPQNPSYYQPIRKYSESRMRVGGPGYGFVHPAPTPVSAPVSAPAPTPVSGLLLITSFEGFTAKAYVDPASGGFPITLGFGSTRNQNGDAFKLDDTITRPEAENLLAHQIEKQYLPSLRKIPYWSEMSDGKQGALLSFAYNLGAKFYGSPDFETITRVLKNKEWNKVPDAFYLYNKASGKVLLGLARRRAAEGSAWKNNTIDEEEIKRIKEKNLSELP